MLRLKKRSAESSFLSLIATVRKTLENLKTTMNQSCFNFQCEKRSPICFHFFQQFLWDPSAVVHGNVTGDALEAFLRGMNLQDSATASHNSKALVLPSG